MEFRVDRSLINKYIYLTPSPKLVSTPLDMTLERSEVISYLNPIASELVALVIRKPDLVSLNVTAYLETFHPLTWLALGINILIIGFIIHWIKVSWLAFFNRKMCQEELCLKKILSILCLYSFFFLPSESYFFHFFFNPLYSVLFLWNGFISNFVS